MMKRILSTVLVIGIIISIIPISFANETKIGLNPQAAYEYADQLYWMCRHVGTSTGTGDDGVAYARLIDFDGDETAELYTVTIAGTGNDYDNNGVATESVWGWKDDTLKQIYTKEHRSSGAHDYSSSGRRIAEKDGKHYLIEGGDYLSASGDYMEGAEASYFTIYGYNGDSFKIVSSGEEKRESYMEGIPQDEPTYPYENKTMYSYSIIENGIEKKGGKNIDLGGSSAVGSQLEKYLSQYNEIDEVIFAGSYVSLDVARNDVSGMISTLQELSMPKYNYPDVTELWKDKDIEDLNKYIDRFTYGARAHMGNFDYTDRNTYANAVLRAMSEATHLNELTNDLVVPVRDVQAYLKQNFGLTISFSDGDIYTNDVAEIWVDKDMLYSNVVIGEGKDTFTIPQAKKIYQIGEDTYVVMAMVGRIYDVESNGEANKILDIKNKLVDQKYSLFSPEKNWSQDAIDYVFEDSEMYHMIVQKGEQGFKLIRFDYTPITEDEKLGRYSILANEKSDFKFNYAEISAFTSLSEYSSFLNDQLKAVGGKKINHSGITDLVEYIEYAITNSEVAIIKAKKNRIKVNLKAVEGSISKVEKSREQLTGILTAQNIEINKEIKLAIRVDSTAIDWEKPVQLMFSEDLLGCIGSADSIKINLGDGRHAIQLREDDIRTIGSLTMQIEKKEGRTYGVTFLDDKGLIIEELYAPITFILPADNELATVYADYKGGSDNWGGQYDPLNRTIEFKTSYSGDYMIQSEAVNIKDVGNLTEEEQKAINFLVSKGYFVLDEESNFNPYDTLTRYDFAAALVKIFFALDRNAVTTFEDVAENSNYYPYVASGQEQSIIAGYSDTIFGGDDNVKRVEMISFSTRILAEKKEYSYPNNPEEYLNFVDNESIAEWANNTVALAVREDLIDNGGVLLPEGEISRADAAVILYRLFMLLYEISPAEIIIQEEIKTNRNHKLPIGLATSGVAAMAGGAFYLLKNKRETESFKD